MHLPLRRIGAACAATGALAFAVMGSGAAPALADASSPASLSRGAPAPPSRTPVIVAPRIAPSAATVQETRTGGPARAQTIGLVV